MSDQVFDQKLWDEKINPIVENLEENQIYELIEELVQYLGLENQKKLNQLTSEVISEMEEV